jgi:hypothetical protein
MRKIAAVLLMAGSLTAAGQASAHDRSGAIVGALIGGAVLGAVVSSALNPTPVYAEPAYPQPVYAQPAYQQPAYQQPEYAQSAYPQPVYQQAPAYNGPPPGYCYDRYQGAYVACGAPGGQYGYAPAQPGW